MYSVTPVKRAIPSFRIVWIVHFTGQIENRVDTARLWYEEVYGFAYPVQQRNSVVSRPIHHYQECRGATHRLTVRVFRVCSGTFLADQEQMFQWLLLQSGVPVKCLRLNKRHSE